jgi:hypothetical protein
MEGVLPSFLPSVYAIDSSTLMAELQNSMCPEDGVTAHRRGFLDCGSMELPLTLSNSSSINLRRAAVSAASGSMHSPGAGKNTKHN